MMNLDSFQPSKLCVQELLCVFILDKNIDMQYKETSFYQELGNLDDSQPSKLFVQELLCIFSLDGSDTWRGKAIDKCEFVI